MLKTLNANFLEWKATFIQAVYIEPKISKT